MRSAVLPCSDALEKGAAVDLLVKDVVVATAKLHEDPGGSKFCRNLHGSELHKVAKDGEDLVVVSNFSASKGNEKTPYPYSCPGIEGTPKDFSTVSVFGMYTWDINMMRVKK